MPLVFTPADQGARGAVCSAVAARCAQVVSKRVANAKSERFYQASLGKKKQQNFWQVTS